MSRAVVLEEPGRLRVDERDVPKPRPDEVLIKVAWAGICGSDVDLRDGNRPLGLARYPVVPGHEWAGVIAGVGAEVDDSLLGTPVVAEGIRPCGICAPCRAGDATRCETMYDETGFTRDGAWADHVVVPVSLTHALPVGADLRSAAGIEPAACAATAVARAEVAAGERVAVIGGGSIGLLTAQLLRGAGASELVVIEPVQARWELAQRCGATRVVPPPAEDDAFDVVIEAAGAMGTAQEAIRMARRGGRVVIVGIPPVSDVLLTQQIVAKQLDLRTVCGAPSRSWELAVRAFTDRTLDPGVLITHELPLDHADEALDLVARGGSGVGKVLLRP